MSEQDVKPIVETLERMIEPSGETLTTLQVDSLVEGPSGKKLWATLYWVYQAGLTEGYSRGWDQGYQDSYE